MRILGIDPGLAIVGFGLIEAETGKTQMLQYGAVTTPAGLPLAARLVQLERDMEELIAQLRPEAIAVEELFFSNNITTGIAVAHARGIILCTAAKSGIPLYEYTPMQVKQAVVGYGLAEKRQVMDMVRRLLKLKAVPRPDDAADAVQDTVLQAWESLGQLRQARYFKTWVVRILLNKCYRISAQRSLYAHSQLEETLLAGEQPDWDQSLDVASALQAMGEQDRLLLGLFYFDRLSTREIAQALGLSESCVRQRLHRGRKRFQAIYTEKEELCHEK